MSGEGMYGKCKICGEEAPLQRTYFDYQIKCECHSPNHFEAIDHCKDCIPKEPLVTKVTFRTEQLKHMVLIDAGELEHLKRTGEANEEGSTGEPGGMDN